MWIKVGNRTSQLVRATDAECDWLGEYLSFPDANARFKRGGDGRVRMLNLFNQSFPSGFVSMVQKAATAEKFEVQVIDSRTAPPLDPAPDLAWLYDYQAASVAKALARQRGILWLATGAGKTELAVGLARAVRTPWLFVVHRTSLGQQAAARFARRNAEHGVDLGEPGVIGEGDWLEGEWFTAATFQTLSKALSKGDPRATALLARCGGLIVDECHVLPAGSFYEVAMASDAHYRIGLSGTPLARGDRRSIYAIAATGPVIHRVKTEELVSRGVLAKAQVKMITVTQPPSAAATFQGVYGDKVVRSAQRNDTITRIAATRATRPGFIFVKEIAHGRDLVKRLGRAGLQVELVFGQHSTDYRMSIVKRLVRGALDFVVCSVVFQEGLDVPELRSIVNAGGSKSIIATLQRLGRGMRVDRAPDGTVRDGGDVFELWDIFDVGNTWLENHAKARRRAYVAEGHQTIVEPAMVTA